MFQRLVMCLLLGGLFSFVYAVGARFFDLYYLKLMEGSYIAPAFDVMFVCLASFVGLIMGVMIGWIYG